MCHICFSFADEFPPMGNVDSVLYLIGQVHLLRSNKYLLIPTADLHSLFKSEITSVGLSSSKETVVNSLFYLFF